MGKIGKCITCCVKWLLRLIAFFMVVVLLPGLPPEGTFTASKVSPSEPLEGKYALNTFLNNANHLYENKLKGPECFAIWNNELYTSVHGGEVVKLLPNGNVQTVVKIGQPCDGFWQESKCGRPLGIAFDKSGTLYITDAYYGIWKYDMKSGKKQLIVSPDTEIEGRKPKLFNSLVLASNGDIYWTDSCQTPLQDGILAMLLDGTGRLIHYDVAKRTNRVLLDGLWFANGVTLSPNEDFVLVAETTRSQLRRYYLKGEKKGTDDIFIDGLPGVPDNLHSCSEGITVPLVSPRDSDHPIIFQSIAPHPLLRKFLARLIALIQLPFEMAQRYVPHYAFERVAHWIGHFESVSFILPKRTTVLRLDWSGNVKEAWHNTDGTLSSISEAIVFKDNLYLGSPYNTYVGRIPFNRKEEAGKHERKAEPPKAVPPKPTAAAPQVKTTTTTTTQKPTTAKPTPKPTPQTKPPPQPAKPTKPAAAAEKPKEQKSTPPSEAKPIVEEIPSDTKPPKKDNMKVIKKEGPSEIPHPEKEKKTPAKNEL